MRIITLIKAIPDLNNVSVSKSQQKIFENNPPIPNPADENALELSLSIKDSQKAEVVVLSLTQASNEKILHKALAMGADQAYLISDTELLSEDPFLKAGILSEAIKKIGQFDLVITGAGSITGNAGQTGPRIAELLDIPQITQIKSVQFKENKIVAEKFIDLNSVISQEEILPCLLSVASGTNKPRMPNALAVIKSGKKEVAKLNKDNLSLEQPVKEAGLIIRSYLP